MSSSVSRTASRLCSRSGEGQPNLGRDDERVEARAASSDRPIRQVTAKRKIALPESTPSAPAETATESA